MNQNLILDNISRALMDICANNQIKKIKKLEVIVDASSGVNMQDLCDHLGIHNESIVGDWTEISLKREDIGGLTAIIHNIQGE